MSQVIHRNKVITYEEFLKKVDIKRIIEKSAKKFYYIGKFERFEEKLDYSWQFLLDNFDDIESIDSFARKMLIQKLLLKVKRK